MVLFWQVSCILGSLTMPDKILAAASKTLRTPNTHE